MSVYELAQINVAYLKAPLDSPELRDFVDNLARLNAMADAADGFRWRLQTEEGDASGLRPMGPEVLINVSVWRDLDALMDYAFRSEHAEFIRRRREWFVRTDRAYAALWWVPQGHRPDASEAVAALMHLQTHGPSPRAFTFKDRYPPPSA